MKQRYIEPLESEKQFVELSRMGKKLAIPILEAYLGFKVWDKNGKVMLNTLQRSHSWTRNVYNAIICQIAGVNPNGGEDFQDGAINIRKTDGSIISANKLDATSVDQFNIDLETGNHGYCGAAGDTSYGIQLGSGANAESFNDYALQTLIGHGNGPGQLSYSSHEPIVKSWNAETRTYSVSHRRYCNNNSGGDIIVRETALVQRGSGGIYKVLRSRDALGDGAILIPNSGQILTTYIISLVFPS